MTEARRKIVVGISGATGSIYGVRLLQTLAKREDAEVHLVVSRWAERTLALEMGLSLSDLEPLCHRLHPPEDVSASIASGSFGVQATAIVPCSMKTLAAVAAGYSADLISRAADVALKERRPLILVARETPLSAIHLKNMLAATEAGATILPPVPAFYGHPQTIEDLVMQTISRVLDHLGFPSSVAYRWEGPEQPPEKQPERPNSRQGDEP